MKRTTSTGISPPLSLPHRADTPSEGVQVPSEVPGRQDTEEIEVEGFQGVTEAGIEPVNGSTEVELQATSDAISEKKDVLIFPAGSASHAKGTAKGRENIVRSYAADNPDLDASEKKNTNPTTAASSSSRKETPSPDSASSAVAEEPAATTAVPAPLPPPTRTNNTRANTSSAPGAFSVDSTHSHRLAPSAYRGADASSAAGSLSGVDSLSDSDEEADDPPPQDVAIDGAVLVEEGMEEGHAGRPNNNAGDSEVIDGTILSTPKPGQRKVSKAGFLVLILVVLGAFGLILGLTIRPREKDSVSDQDNTNEAGGDLDITNGGINEDLSNDAMTPPPSGLMEYEPYTDQLPKAINIDIMDIGGPYYWANIWMLEDPFLDTYDSRRQEQRLHLAAYYYTSNGDTWHQNDGWLDYNVSECQWFSKHHTAYPSVPICDDENKIRIFNLTNNNLQGSFPRLAHFIPTIEHYDISHNYMNGTLPLLSSQPDLLSFIVGDNDFTGITSGSYFDSFGLQRVRTSNNRLHGLTPGLWPLVPELEYFANSGNLYGGAVASEIFLCTKLRHLAVANQFKSSSIPTEIGKVTLLEYYNMSHNPDIIGNLPSEMGLLTNLATLDIAGTSITGDIPQSLCNRVLEGSLEIFANCSLLSCCT